MDFLTFKQFISTEVLIIFYYLGAIVLPVSLLFLGKWLLREFNIINSVYNSGKAIIWKSLNSGQKIKLTMAFICCFIFMELFWRMLFEFLIAYMQIRDALLQSQV